MSQIKNINNVANAVSQELPHLLESDRKPWVISDYQIESFEFVARGGFGQVYRIKQRDQPDTVLKVQAAENSSLKACLKMYDLAKNEAEIVGCLVHPNIIKLIKHKGYTNPFERRLAGYYTMQFELCQKSLYDFIKGNQQKGTLYNRFISDNLLRQIGSAVKHMHELRIAHHDIKPDNIMVVNDSVPRRALQFKLIDFGLAKKYSPELSLESTRDNRYAGTGWYMCEDKIDCHTSQKGPNASYNPYLADVYALGVTLIECAMGFEAKIPNNRVYNSRMAAVQRMILKLSSVDHVSGLVRLGLIRMLPLFEKHRSQMHEILK